MTHRGHIRNGVIQPNEPLPWPEGTEVFVVPVGQKSLKNLLGLIQSTGQLPTDEDCAKIREAELLREDGT